MSTVEARWVGIDAWIMAQEQARWDEWDAQLANELRPDMGTVDAPDLAEQAPAPRLDPHGESMYNRQGCRCEVCCAAKAAKNAADYQSRKALQPVWTGKRTRRPSPHRPMGTRCKTCAEKHVRCTHDNPDPAIIGDVSPLQTG